MELGLQFSIKEKSIDTDKRTVLAGVLEENILSANNRFYPARVVRESMSNLVGKKSLVGHDTSDVRDVVAKVVESRMEGKLGIAKFKFGEDAGSQTVFQKVKEGLIDSVSIRANGETRRAKIGEEFVDVVESLDIFSVDWVLEGGVKSAKVLKVFESAPEIKDAKEELNMDELKELQGQVKEQGEKIDKLIEANETLQEENKKLKEESTQKTLEAHKKSLIAKISDEKSRELVEARLTGKTIKELDAQFEAEVKYLKALNKSVGVNEEEVVVKPTDKGKQEDDGPSDMYEFMEHKEIDKKDKAEALSTILG